MNFSKKKSIFFIPLFFLSLSNPTYCDELDDLSFDDLLDFPAVNNFLEENVFEIKRGFDPGEIVDILYNIGIVDILQEDFYLRTNPLNYRSVLDLPMGLMDKDYCYEESLNGVDFFWNKMDRAHFTTHSDAICSYLALTQEGFLDALANAADKSKELAEADFDFDPAEVFDLFKNGTVQERKLGVLLYGRGGTKSWRFSWHIPFYYLERNFWITEPEQEEIEKQLGAADAETQEQLQDQHLVADKLGFGDARVAFDFHLYDSERTCSRLGLFATLPIAWALAKGLKGNSFEPLTRTPSTNIGDLTGYHLDEIINMGISDDPDERAESTRIMTNLAYQAIDHLASNLLEAPMGNGRHFGIGAVLRSMWQLSALIDRPWAEKIWVKARTTLEYLAPATETRQFAEQINQEDFDGRDFEDTTQGESNMLFLEEQIVGKLFPYAIPVTVSPGFVFSWTSKLYHEREWWGIYLGSEYWLRSKEKLSEICVPEFLKNRLKLGCAQRPFAFQYKILGGLYFKYQRPNRNWVFSLNGETTAWKRGIGGDYTVWFNFEVDF